MCSYWDLFWAAVVGALLFAAIRGALRLRAERIEREKERARNEQERIDKMLDDIGWLKRAVGEATENWNWKKDYSQMFRVREYGPSLHDRLKALETEKKEKQNG